MAASQLAQYRQLQQQRFLQRQNEQPVDEDPSNVIKESEGKHSSSDIQEDPKYTGNAQIADGKDKVLVPVVVPVVAVAGSAINQADLDEAYAQALEEQEREEQERRDAEMAAVSP